MASLYLPSLNADIIDNGIARGDTGYIMATGGSMLAVTLLQVVCSIAAVYFGARTAMGFGRDVRSALFHRVGEFSARELSRFGAPSLITRNTNDVQQVADARAGVVHDAGRRADHVRRRRGHGAAGGRRPFLADGGQRARC